MTNNTCAIKLCYRTRKRYRLSQQDILFQNSSLTRTGVSAADIKERKFKRHTLDDEELVSSCVSEPPYSSDVTKSDAAVRISNSLPIESYSGPLILEAIRDNESFDQGYYSELSLFQNKKLAFDIKTGYFSEAENRAYVSFLHHQVLECDSNGREYTNMDHDITLKIPEGAVPEGKIVHFEIAIALYGAFVFPSNTQPISPILWLCIMEEDVELQKPFQIVLPHYLADLSKDKMLHHRTIFAKASHNTYAFQNEQMNYEFHPCKIKPRFAFNGCRGYGVLESNHCCFYCLLANQTADLVKDASHCLIRIESSLTLQRSEVYFTAVYFLDSCLKVMLYVLFMYSLWKVNTV